MAADVFLVSLYCSSTGHPQVGKFTWNGTAWLLVGVSRQRPGTSLPEESGQAGGEHHGSFNTASGYTGCPSCGSSAFVRCGGCARLACWDRTWDIFRCPHCGNSGPVSGNIESISPLQHG